MNTAKSGSSRNGMSRFLCDGFLSEIKDLLRAILLCRFALHLCNEGTGPLTVVVEFGDDSHERGDEI